MLKQQCSLLLASMALSGCEYLPHNPKLDLTSAEKETVIKQAQTANSAILHAFKTHNVVAIGDYHWNESFINYATQLVSSDEFTSYSQDIVVEFGNAKHQSLINAYVAGAAISESELVSVFRDTLYFLAWQPEAYLNFFKAVRQKNLSLPQAQRIRVHLAESSFDWESADRLKWKQAAESKTEGFYTTLESLIQQDKNVLAIFGAFHLVYTPQSCEQGEGGKNLFTRLAQGYPESTYTVFPMSEPSIWQSFTTLGEPSLLDASQQPFNSLRLIDLFPKSRFKLAAMGCRTAKVGELFDAMLYVGPNHRLDKLPESVKSDQMWMHEMDRRMDIIGGKMKDKYLELKNNAS